MSFYKIIPAAIILLFSHTTIAASLYEGALEDRIADLEQAISEMGNAMKVPDTPNTLYGSVRIAFKNSGEGVDEKSEFSNVSSRFGFKNNRDLGDGLTGMFRLEYGLDGNFGLANSGTRIAYVGVKGDFGDIRLGNSWGPAYNFVGGKADVFTNTQSLAYDYLGTYRINNAIHYSNKAGNIKYQGAAQIGQGVEKTGVNKWIFGAGTELAPKTNIGAYYNTADASADGADSTGYGVGIDYSPTSDIYLAVSYSAVNSDNDADDVTGIDFAAVIGLSGVLGNGTTLRFEYGTVSPDDSVASGDITGTQIGLRRQFKSFNMFTWVYNSDSDTTSNAKTYIAGVRYDF